MVNEAMAAGLPVIVSKQCNCSRYLVDDGVNGYLVDADLDETIFEAIKILESPGRLADFGIASRRMIQDFGLEKFARNLWAACSYVMSVDQGKLDIFSRGLMVFWRARINMKRFNG